jgi:hypothetical protein
LAKRWYTFFAIEQTASTAHNIAVAPPILVIAVFLLSNTFLLPQRKMPTADHIPHGTKIAQAAYINIGDDPAEVRVASDRNAKSRKKYAATPFSKHDCRSPKRPFQ